MALQIDALIEEIKNTSEHYNENHGILLEDLNINSLENFDYDLAESESDYSDIDERTFALIEAINEREHELLLLIEDY